jgi:L-lactate dehydrogenase (cytochrome)
MNQKIETGVGASATVPTALAAHSRRYPCFDDLRRAAKRRVPGFGFEYLDGGAGMDIGVARNAASLDAVEIVPRYGNDVSSVSLDVELFGCRYAAPIGIAPMGFPSLIWPGAEEHLARAAQRARIPYTFGVVAGAEIERIAPLTPDVFWFQLYRYGRNDHKIGFDIVRRAQAAGAHVLVLTLDVPSRAKRPRELRNGLVFPYKPDARAVFDVLTSPAWVRALLKHGAPRFANLTPYIEKNATPKQIGDFVSREMGGSFTWEEVARYRDLWKGPLVVKGILHPDDAERAIAVGVDGIQVSNHGGRQLEGAPAAIDVLPAIAARVKGRATILMDSGIRSGLDVIRAVALGASAAISGRMFMYGVAALGDEGADYVIGMLVEEIHAALRQLGICSMADAASLVTRHPGALEFPSAPASVERQGHRQSG